MQGSHNIILLSDVACQLQLKKIPSDAAIFMKASLIKVPWRIKLSTVPLFRDSSISRPKCPHLRLGHLQVGKLQHWHFCPPCIRLDITVQFTLKSGIRAWTQIWVHAQLSSSGPHCTKRWPVKASRVQASVPVQLHPPYPHFQLIIRSLTLYQVLTGERQRLIYSMEVGEQAIWF